MVDAEGKVLAVHISGTHSFSKQTVDRIVLQENLGVAGDAHCGALVKHRSRVAADPTQPNLRQVHLVHSELFAELALKGFHLAPGDIGENITTSGINLLSLPTATQLLIGKSAVVTITGLRNPCAQLDAFRPGLTAAVLDRNSDGTLVRKAGLMGVVTVAGVVVAGDVIRIILPPLPHYSLERV
jgi:MOSC domain-containing protein YiiM